MTKKSCKASAEQINRFVLSKIDELAELLGVDANDENLDNIFDAFYESIEENYFFDWEKYN